MDVKIMNDAVEMMYFVFKTMMFSLKMMCVCISNNAAASCMQQIYPGKSCGGTRVSLTERASLWACEHLERLYALRSVPIASATSSLHAARPSERARLIPRITKSSANFQYKIIVSQGKFSILSSFSIENSKQNG